MSDRKYLFFDIDGTLASGVPGKQHVPASTELALKKLRDAGHFLAIATGRAHAMAVDYMRGLGFENMVSDGGWGTTINGEFQGVRPLDHDACVDLVDECRAKDFIWGIQVEDSNVRFVPDDRFYEATHDIYMRTRIVPGLDPRNYPEIYKVYIACLEPHEQELDNLKRLPWCRFHREYLFVEPADKAYGIKKIVDAQGGSYEDVIVFGDGKNDLSMFIPTWTSVAMGNAVPELKQRASIVTTDIDDDGIYKACVQLGLF